MVSKESGRYLYKSESDRLEPADIRPLEKGRRHATTTDREQSKEEMRHRKRIVDDDIETRSNEVRSHEQFQSKQRGGVC